MIFLDYDGTLTATHKIPEFATPASHILNTLAGLNSIPNTYVYVLSGRGRVHLDKWFEATGIGLSAEHGCYYKHPHALREQIGTLSEGEGREEGDGWYRLVNQFDMSWRDVIRPLFQHYTERTPGSFIEEKEVESFRCAGWLFDV